MWGIERGAVLLTLGLTAIVARPDRMSAQDQAWRIVGGASQVWFGGGVTDTTGGGLHLRPSASVAWSVGADRRIGRVRVGMALSYLSAALEISGSGVAVVTEDLSMRQFEIAALVAIPLLRAGQGAELSLAAGPALHIWSVTGADSRTRFGALGVLQFAAPISSNWKLLVSLAGSVSGSPFEASELPVEFEPSTLRTGRVGVGVQYGF